ncbi:MAG: hypothetical protein ABUT39_15540 [Acidobacteriota bacterium]
MIIDPIVERLHKQREEYMEQFHYDLDAIIRDIKAHEAACETHLLEAPASPPLKPATQGIRFARR